MTASFCLVTQRAPETTVSRVRPEITEIAPEKTEESWSDPAALTPKQ
jgi:hypothetical protein